MLDILFAENFFASEKNYLSEQKGIARVRRSPQLLLILKRTDLYSPVGTEAWIRMVI